MPCMLRPAGFALLALAMILGLGGAEAAPAGARAAARPSLVFEANHGQADVPVEFVARGLRYTVYLTASEAVLAVGAGDAAEGPGSRVAVRIALDGSGTGTRPAGIDRQPGFANYFVGSDPSRWRTRVPTYSRVRQPEVYPGVDVVYYGTPDGLEYDFVVAPGADPHRIALSIDASGVGRGTGGREAAATLALDDRGDLLIQTAGGVLRQRRPFAYQDIAGTRGAVAASYVLRRDGRVGFALGAYDPAHTLTIDPVLVFSTYLGGPGDATTAGADQGEGVAVDAAGPSWLVGSTDSLAFPVVAPAQPMSGGGRDVFVARFTADGSALVYATYLGGGGNDLGRAIAVDGALSAYLTGETLSTDFPATGSPYQAASGGGRDAFIAQLDAAGALTYASYLGGSDDDRAEAIGVDELGHAFLAGVTFSADFPAPAGYDTTYNGSGDAFVTRFDFAVTPPALGYSTFLGGTRSESSFARSGIAVGALGHATVVGRTNSPDFPATAGAYSTVCANCLAGEFMTEIFVAKLDPSGSVLQYSTFFGGIGRDDPGGAALDAAGNVYFTGITSSPHFPTTAGTVQPGYRGGPWRSVDAAATWTAHNANLPDSSVSAFAWLPGTAPALFAATGSGLFRSLDAGSSWLDVNSDFAPNTRFGVRDLAVDPAVPDTVYAAINTGSVAKSVDRGVTWTWVGNPATSGLLVNWVEALAIGPAAGPDPQLIYAGGRGLNAGVYVSLDGGANWKRRISGLGATGNPFVQDIAVSAAAPVVAYCTVDGEGVFKSVDAGENWAAVNTGLGSLQVSTLEADPLDPDVIYAGTRDAGVFRTTTGGTAWVAVNTGLTSLGVLDLAIDPASPDTVYAGTLDGAFKSVDGGASWTAASTGLTNRRIGAVFVNPASSLVVHAGSADGNRTFAVKLSPAGDGPADLVYSTFLGGTLSERGWSIAVDAGGRAWVAGETSSADLPLVNAIDATCDGAPAGFCGEAFVAQLDPTASSYLFSSYLGGGGVDAARAIAVSGDSAWLAGSTSSTNFPVANAYQAAREGSEDAFLARVGPGVDLPPKLTVELSPDVLWPLTRRLVPITATIFVDDDSPGPVEITLISIVSSEPAGAASDIQDAAIGTDDRSFRLRAWRNARGPGRVYVVTYRARDSAGHEAFAEAKVTVPRRRR